MFTELLFRFNKKKRELMGRKKKFGEESDFVSVRVPKSKRNEYRVAIKNFVEKKFTSELNTNNKFPQIKINKKDLKGFRKFEEFIKEIDKLDKEKK